MPDRLTLTDLANAAMDLGCDLAAVKAVVEVESGPLGGFDRNTGKPIILYEPHVFSRLTAGRFDQDYPTLSYPRWKTHPYPKTQEARWAQVEEARKLDAFAADAATSWGLFQIMGFNHARAGHEGIGSFVTAMHRSENEHLRAFVAFVKSGALDAALRVHDWREFARGYNGAGQVARYAGLLKAAWKRHGGGA